MSKCYVHQKIASTRNCSKCSKAICRECVFEEVVSSRVLRSTQVDREIEYDYDFFCPHCFITYAENKGYNLGSQGVYFRFKKSPSIMGVIFLWSLFAIGFTINFFFPIGYIL
ncbi:MAG: hypothetical protein JXA54_12395 [Candidatus Heimdallarchaeota archaeon]|nr:hypothetical protein [Candidatus Heimdallarchaeota archaeon]